MRTTDALPGTMKSISATLPVDDPKIVSNTSVSGRYRRVTVKKADSGPIHQRPFSGDPSRAAKQAGLSKRGQHSQSMEPALLTSAAVRQSLSRA